MEEGMQRTTRNWLPPYLDPAGFIPRITETRVLFQWPPFFFPEFLGKVIAFLQSDDARKMGFEFDYRRILPCTWKCSDESLFMVPLSLLAYFGANVFPKGLIGARFNEQSLGAAVHHGSINVDLGGSHVGYLPGERGGSFGYIWRPQQKEFTSDCGYLTSVFTPFASVYQDASQNILLFRPQGSKVLASIPNEFLQPNWSSHRVKLLVDIETFTAGQVEYRDDTTFTHTTVARSLFYVHPEFLQGLDPRDVEPFLQEKPTPIGRFLSPKYFNIFDTQAPLDQNGLPRERLMLYMKYIVAPKYSPVSLKAAIVNTNLEHNRLTDTLRSPEYTNYSFACFTGIFMDLFDHEVGNYYNLFQPLSITIKPAGKKSEVELTPEEIQFRFARLNPAEPRLNLLDMTGFKSVERLVERFTFKPGRFEEFSHHNEVASNGDEPQT
jgi:hypothetical protein